MMREKNGIRVALATCHDKRNYGSMLQAWATQEFLGGRGYDVRTIDKGGLSREISAGRRGHYLRHALDVNMFVEKAPFALHRARQRVSREFGDEMRRRSAAFDGFARKRFRLTRRTFGFDEACELSSPCLSKRYTSVVVAVIVGHVGATELGDANESRGTRAKCAEEVVMSDER